MNSVFGLDMKDSAPFSLCRGLLVGQEGFSSCSECCLQVIKQLKALYNDLYTERNVGISGIHTHSGPAGFHQYVLYDITSWGFVKESFDSLVKGIVEVNVHFVFELLGLFSVP